MLRCICMYTLATVFSDFSTSMSGDCGMKKMKTMTLTTLSVVSSLALDCKSSLSCQWYKMSYYLWTRFKCVSYFRHYDILEERVPAGLVAEYKLVLEKCTRCFQQFSLLRSSLSSDSDSELDNISMVEGLKLCEQLDEYKRKLYFIENPLLRQEKCFTWKVSQLASISSLNPQPLFKLQVCAGLQR